jgi:hypothetical protein
LSVPFDAPVAFALFVALAVLLSLVTNTSRAWEGRAGPRGVTNLCAA